MYFLADFLFDGNQIISNAFVEVDTDGRILAVGKTDELKDNTISYQKLDGLLMPGFVNTHCHLELSHMENKVSTGTGLLPFIKGVMSLRESEDKEILKAIHDQDQYMWENGIQAVGDISNKTDTIEKKKSSSIIYHSFIEMFDLLSPKLTDRAYKQYRQVYDKYQAEELRSSAVPHAPYTVTQDLFQQINKTNTTKTTISIHNQETEAEDQLFILGKGAFLTFYEDLNLPLDNFQATYESSIHYTMKHMDPKHRYIFVHNTQTTEHDIAAAQNWNEDIYWCTCPNANLYIENRLPNYQSFINQNAKMTIGTDSLTSNWQLSILEEMKTIHRFNSYLEITEVLKWATINGAEALGLQNSLGSISVGKNPGLVLVENFEIGSIQNCTAIRLA